MFDAICIGLRVVSLLAVGLLNIREYVPGSIDNKPAPIPPPITDQMRYERGEIWWYENRDDLAAIDLKATACRTVRTANDSSIKQKLGCFCQGQKERIKYAAVASVKSLCRFVIEMYTSYRHDLSGPNPWFPLLKIICAFTVLAYGIGKAYQYRALILATLIRWFWEAKNFIRPTQVPPPEPIATVPYVSDAAQIVLEQIKNAGPDVPFATFWNHLQVPVDAAADPRPPSPTGSPRAEMPRGNVPLPAAANLAAIAPVDNAPGDAGAFVGGNRTPSPRVSPRASPRAQRRASTPNQAAPVVDESPVIDLAAARVMHGLYRREQTLINAPPEQVAEPVDPIPAAAATGLKKRVAFRDDPVDRGIQRASNLSASRRAAATAAAAAAEARNIFHTGTNRDREQPQIPASPPAVQMAGPRLRVPPRNRASSAGTGRRVGGTVN